MNEQGSASGTAAGGEQTGSLKSKADLKADYVAYLMFETSTWPMMARSIRPSFDVRTARQAVARGGAARARAHRRRQERRHLNGRVLRVVCTALHLCHRLADAHLPPRLPATSPRFTAGMSLEHLEDTERYLQA